MTHPWFRDSLPSVIRSPTDHAFCVTCRSVDRSGSGAWSSHRLNFERLWPSSWAPFWACSRITHCEVSCHAIINPLRGSQSKTLCPAAIKEEEHPAPPKVQMFGILQQLRVASRERLEIQRLSKVLLNSFTEGNGS